MTEKLGIMVCGHGSRNQNAAKEFSKVASGLRKLFPDLPVEYGTTGGPISLIVIQFLEVMWVPSFGTPVEEALEETTMQTGSAGPGEFPFVPVGTVT